MFIFVGASTLVGKKLTGKCIFPLTFMCVISYTMYTLGGRSTRQYKDVK